MSLLHVLAIPHLPQPLQIKQKIKPKKLQTLQNQRRTHMTLATRRITKWFQHARTRHNRYHKRYQTRKLRPRPKSRGINKYGNA